MAQNREPISAEQIRQLQLLAQGLRFGALTLVFQDGKLIQMQASASRLQSGTTSVNLTLSDLRSSCAA